MADLHFPNAPAETTSYYEFLLDEDRLKIHLALPNPDPNGCELINKFFEQANKPLNDQGQVLPPPENEKNLTLKCLALQTGAFLKWDLNLFDKELPMSCRHQLLRELLAFCNAPSFPSRALDIKNQIKTMHDHTVMAIVLYCRWAARTVVKSAFPVKPSGRTTPTAPAPGLYQVNAQQRYEELKEQIVTIVKDQCFDVVQTLETFLQQMKRPMYLPDFDTIKDKQLCSPHETRGWRVSLEELHAQVCYDLGCLHFMHEFYDKAHEMFGHVKDWLNCFPENTSGYCDINRETLSGYLTACSALNMQPGAEPPVPSDEESLFTQIVKSVENKDNLDIQLLGNLLMKDIAQNELPMSFRDQLEQDLMHKNQESSNTDAYFDIIWLNAICRAIRGYPQPTCLWTYELTVVKLQRILGFVEQSCVSASRKERKKLGGFLYSLYNNLFREKLRQQLLQSEITKQCVSEVDLREMEQREMAHDEVIVQDSPMSPDDATAGPLLVAELENKMVTSFEPDALKQTLTKLHKISPEMQHWRICDRWFVNHDYENVIKTINVALNRDLMYVSLAKVNHCLSDADLYPTAKRILIYIQENSKSLSFKLQKIVSNELLRIEILELINDPNLEFSGEKECRQLKEQFSDTLKRAKQHLLSKSLDVVPSPTELSELSIALLLNLEDFSFFDSISSQSSTGILRLVKILSKVHFKTSNSHNDAKRSANNLWNAFAEVFTASTCHQRRSQDNVVIVVKKSDIPAPLVSRPALLSLVKKIRNQNILRIVLSALVRLHRICQEDILADIKVPLSDIWPSSLPSGQPAVSAPCLANMVREVLTHCLTVQPNNTEWIRAQADVDFAYCNYPSAFRSYLKLIAVRSNFFSADVLHSGILDSQLVRRMVKCCMQMRCNTQAAVLCQMGKDVDYSTAFKALQESRECADAMETHYREHFWDVELLEYATCMHRDTIEVAKKESALRALANHDINICNTPKVLKEVQIAKSQRFFRVLARQFLV